MLFLLYVRTQWNNKMILGGELVKDVEGSGRGVCNEYSATFCKT